MKMKTERYGSLVRVSAEAPKGRIWSASGVHELVAEARGGSDATRAARKDVRDRMNEGTEMCSDPDCDWCNEE